jgi:cell shape-determining protein MreC
MAGKTISQRLDDLAERVGAHIPVTERRLDEVEEELHSLAEDVRRLERLPQQLGDLKERVKQLEAVESQAIRHDERLKTLEKTSDKSSDRRWQLAPILVSAGGVLISTVGVVVAIVIALAKK